MMLLIYVTGDTHGRHDIGKLSEEAFPEQKNLTRDDKVIITGDFGLVFSGTEAEQMYLDWLQDRNFTTLFVDGNHENFDMLNRYDIEDWNGGKVHFIRPNVIHLMRGYVFNIDNKKIFTFGGASSIDKAHRIEGISWWPEELPSKAEENLGLHNLDKVDWKVDYVITHGCASQDHTDILAKHGRPNQTEYDSLNKYLANIKLLLEYKRWFCGHYHIDETLNDVEFLYDKITCIS